MLLLTLNHLISIKLTAVTYIALGTCLYTFFFSNKNILDSHTFNEESTETKQLTSMQFLTFHRPTQFLFTAILKQHHYLLSEKCMPY